MGLVPRNVRRGLGRGRGTTSVVPQEALPQLVMAAGAARQGRALVPEPVFTRLLAGLEVSDEAVRAAVVRQLRRFMRAHALDRVGDAGWQTRSDRIRRRVRGWRRGWRPPLTFAEMLAGRLDPVMSEDEGQARRAAALVYGHAFAGDVDGIGGEEWARATALIEGRHTSVEVDRVVAEVRAQELAGVDPVAQVVPTISWPRLVDAAATVDAGALRRAILVMKLVNAGHAALAAQQFYARFRQKVPGAAEWDHLLPPLLRRTPDLGRLQGHRWWKDFLHGSAPTGKHANAEIAAMAVTLAADPSQLNEMNDYLDMLYDTTGMQRNDPVPSASV